MNKILVSKIPNLNSIVIKQIGDGHYFMTTSDSIIITVPSLSALIKYLVKHDYVSIKVLEGILSELTE